MSNQNVVSPHPHPHHVLMLPLPLQGPVNEMLKLAELLCLENIRVTFVNTHHIQQRLLNCTNTQIYWQKYPNFSFQAVPDGLPEDNPRSAYQFCELMRSVEAVVAPILGEMVETCGVDSGNPVTCIIADGILSFASEIGAKSGVPLLYFETCSPCVLWTYICILPKLIQDGDLPFKDDNLDQIITNAPGTEAVIRRRDLPSFCRNIDFDDPQVQLVLEEIKNVPSSQGLILNTFQDLDGPILSELLKFCPNIYAVGPLHSHLKTRLIAETDRRPTINSNSIWKEDRSCISWLDQQLPKSVIYVSIGSLCVMTKDQFFEIWHGLVSSGSKFLWVRRPGSVTGFDPNIDENIPTELLQGTKESGYIVSWAPQEEVLAHWAVGGFLTHSGWNSTLESIAAGKPMICWPHYVDQHVNSRYVGEVWKFGLDMKDTCNRVTVERMIREVMKLRKDDFLGRVEEMAKLGKSSVCKEGSSIMDFDRLINDFKKLMKIPTV
ncbi:hypothetical protein ACS0TY_000940 [Phlomoides rotata]